MTREQWREYASTKFALAGEFNKTELVELLLAMWDDLAAQLKQENDNEARN